MASAQFKNKQNYPLCSQPDTNPEHTCEELNLDPCQWRIFLLKKIYRKSGTT